MSRRAVQDRIASALRLDRVPDTLHQERERTTTRTAVWLGIVAVWAIDAFLGRPLGPAIATTIVLGSSYVAATLAHDLLSRRRGRDRTLAIGATLAIDPVFLNLVLATDPERFAFLYPLVLFLIVRSGFRYGIRSMVLSWSCAIASAPLLLASDAWRSSVELLLSFVVLLILVPMFFASLIRRVHNVRAIEEDRAHLAAANESLVARSAFLAKVSHELRSPLQNIVSALDLFELRHGPASRDDQELIGRMRRSSLLLNTQLRDLLTLAKGEAGRLEIRPEPFEACSLVEALAESARDLADSKGLELAVQLPADAVFVVADGARIDQILTNLVINSIRYTDRGQVRIAMQAYDPALRRLRFDVADTGPGIPDAVIPTLFAPDKVLTGAERRGEGSGIGLAIVRTLVAQLGGTVTVSSRLGRGTTFTVEIPAEPVVEDDAASPAAAGRVLVVDDREEVRDAVASVVGELGRACDRAASAAIAGNLVASRRYDVVLLDLELPRKGGAELAAEIRRGNGPNRDTRLVAMGAAAAARNADFDLVLAQPLDRAAIRHALHLPGVDARPSQAGLRADEGSPA